MLHQDRQDESLKVEEDRFERLEKLIIKTSQPKKSRLSRSERPAISHDPRSERLAVQVASSQGMLREDFGYKRDQSIDQLICIFYYPRCTLQTNMEPQNRWGTESKTALSTNQWQPHRPLRNIK